MRSLQYWLQIIKLGARLGGATKELLPNLDTYKNNEKIHHTVEILVFWWMFWEANLLIFVRPSVRACARPSVKIQVVIEIFWGIKNQDTCPDTFYAERPQNARTRRYKPQKDFFLKQHFNNF